MKKLTFVAVLAIHSFFFISCSNSNKDVANSVVETIHKSKLTSNKYLQLVDSLVFNNSDSNIVGAIANIYPWGKYILISDYVNKAVHVFDKNFKYVKKIGREGKGPGEYNSVPIIVKSFADTLKLLKVLEKKICLYDLELDFLDEEDLPKEFNYQFRLPVEVNSKLVFSIGYPASVADISYYTKYKSLAVINSKDFRHLNDIFSWDPIYHDENFSGYTGSYFGVITSLYKDYSLIAIQRASKFITQFDESLNPKMKFGINSKYYKIPKKKKT